MVFDKLVIYFMDAIYGMGNVNIRKKKVKYDRVYYERKIEWRN